MQVAKRPSPSQSVEIGVHLASGHAYPCMQDTKPGAADETEVDALEIERIERVAKEEAERGPRVEPERLMCVRRGGVWSPKL